MTTGRRGNWQGRASLPPGHYFRRELAKQIGVSMATIIRWSQEGLLKPQWDTTRQAWIHTDRDLAVGKRLLELSQHNLETRKQIICDEFGSQAV